MWMIIYLVNANDEITTNKVMLKLELTDFRMHRKRIHMYKFLHSQQFQPC